MYVVEKQASLRCRVVAGSSIRFAERLTYYVETNQVPKQVPDRHVFGGVDFDRLGDPARATVNGELHGSVESMMTVAMPPSATTMMKMSWSIALEP